MADTTDTTPAAVVPRNEDPNHPFRWVHRRRMAYMSLFSIFILTIWIMGPWMPIDRLKEVGSVVEYFYLTMASVVGAYVGFATWAAKSK